MTTSTIFPESREVCLISSSMSKRFAATTSPSAPPAGVDPVQPIASTCNCRRIGSSNSPCAVPRVHPRQSWYFSLCTFSRPITFILAAPQSSAFRSDGDAVTRAPMSSLNSVRYWNACESIIPSPAIFTSAGFVPSSSGPFGRLSARAVHAPPRQNPSAANAVPASTRRIRFLLRAFTQTNSITLSDALPAFRFPCALSTGNFSLRSLRTASTPTGSGCLCVSLPFFFANSGFRSLHIAKPSFSHLFTRLLLRPKLPARPSCDFIPSSIRSCVRSQCLFCLLQLFLPPR